MHIELESEHSIIKAEQEIDHVQFSIIDNDGLELRHTLTLPELRKFSIAIEAMIQQIINQGPQA